jgi:YVTN family beta-propeller protein
LIVQTNSAGDNVHLIDAATNKVVGDIPGIERAHGAVASPDGNWLYVSNEADTTTDVVNVKTLKVTKKIPLSGHPNNIAITPNGRKVYVAIAQAPGALDVIDTASQTKTRTISVHGGVHNVYVTPDGKHAVAGMIGARNMTVVDTQTDMPVWTHYFDLGVRPMTFDANPDGSTRRAYAQLSEFNGFAVVDFATRKEVARIKYPEVPKDKQTPGHGGNTAHGIGVTPDNRYLVANSSLNSTTYVYSLPDLKLVGGAVIGHSPNWVTITPDGKFAYVSLAGSNSVAVLDIAAAKKTAEIKTGGQVPKRNATMVVTQ